MDRVIAYLYARGVCAEYVAHIDPPISFVSNAAPAMFAPLQARKRNEEARKKRDEERRKKAQIREKQRQIFSKRREEEYKKKAVEAHVDSYRQYLASLKDPVKLMSKLGPLRCWFRILTGNALPSARESLQPMLTDLRRIETKVVSSMGSSSDASYVFPAEASLVKSTRALANAETEVRSVLASLENKGVTVDNAEHNEMNEVRDATVKRDKTCATGLKSAERALPEVKLELEKANSLSKEVSSHLVKVRKVVGQIRLKFEEIGGDWKKADDQDAGAAPGVSVVPDWKWVNDSWNDVEKALKEEQRASSRALAAKQSQPGLYDQWNDARTAVKRTVEDIILRYDDQKLAVFNAARRAFGTIVALENQADAIHGRVKSSIESGKQRILAVQEGLERLILRAQELIKSKVLAEKYEEKFFDIEREKQNLKNSIDEKQKAYTRELRRRRRQKRKVANLKKEVAKAEKDLRVFVKDPANRRVVSRLLELSKIRPELTFYNKDIDPFAGIPNGGRRVRSFEEYDDVVPLSSVGSRGGSASPSDVAKLYSATHAADEDGQNGPAHAKSAECRAAEDTRLDPILAAVNQLKSEGKNQSQIIRQLRKEHNVRDIITAWQRTVAAAADPTGGGAKVPSPASEPVPCVLKAFDGNRVLKDLRRAVHVMGNMSHTNVIKLQGICRDDKKGRWLIQLPRYPRDLWEWVQTEHKATMAQPGTNGRTSAEIWQGRCARMLGDILRGLDYLHSRGVVHRDLKPRNVLVGPPMASAQDLGEEEEYPVISDFETCAVETLSSGTMTTRNVVSDGYVDPQLLLGRVGASPETDMYSFGVLMGEVLLGRRLKDDAIQDVVKSADAPHHNISSEQRDIVVSLLRDPAGDANSYRPSAAEILRLPFFSSGPSAMRKCSICSETFSLERKEGLCCLGGHSGCRHFFCNDHFQDLVRSDAGKSLCLRCPLLEEPAEYVTERQANGRETKTRVRCRSDPFPDFLVAQHVSPEVLGRYIDGKLTFKSEQVRIDESKKMKSKFQQWQAADKADRAVSYIFREILVCVDEKSKTKETLTNPCPHCRVPFLGFDGCFMLTCANRACGKRFCGWCLGAHISDNYNFSQAHSDVANCHYAPRQSYFGTQMEFEQACYMRRKRKLEEHLRSIDREVARKAVQQCRKDLDTLGFRSVADKYNPNSH